ncbi:hypothetical protein ACFVU2_19975 [Leifsonia sp. NPDC058194]|uniref:hypothetical protein n=1 Tax=Leifsonia sp. NPDC058194 TaxID=3346374 RepID=UPI0036DB5CC3
MSTMPFGAEDIPPPDAWREFWSQVVEAFHTYPAPTLFFAIAGAVAGLLVGWAISEAVERFFEVEAWPPIVYTPSIAVGLSFGVWLAATLLPPAQQVLGVP